MSDDSIENDIRDFLKTEFGIRDEDLGEGQALFSGGLLDSLNALNVVVFLESRFGLKISPLDVTVGDIDSVAMIADFARQRMAG